MLFLLLSILVLCTGALCIVSPEAAENALHRWLQPFNPPERYTFTQLDPSPDHPGHSPGGKPRVRTQTGGFHQVPGPETGHYVFGNRVRQQTTLADGVYKVLIPPLQQADRLEFSAGDVVRRMRIVPKARPSLLSAAATVAYPEYMDRPDGREPMRAGVISAPEGLHADAGGYRLPASGLSPPRPRESPCAWTAAR